MPDHLIFIKAVLISGAANLFMVSLPAQDIRDTVTGSLYTNAPFAGSVHYNKMLTDAMILQNRVDSLGKQAEGYRQEIMFMDNVSERNRLQFHLGIIEEEMKGMQAEADSLFRLLYEMKDFGEENKDILLLDTIIDGIKVYRYRTEPNINKDIPDNSTEISLPQSNIFSISKKSVYSPDKPFESGFKIPSGCFYRIQLAAITRAANWDQFGGIQPVIVEPYDDGRLLKYYAGKFTNYAEADSALVRVRAEGFRDAFIIGYYNGKRMSTEQVREFEKSKR